MHTSRSHESTYRLVLTALLTALVVVLQIISSYVKFGPFSITLTLIPVVVGGILLGPKYGASLGGLFGLIVLIFCIAGVDGGGYILFSVNPFLTALTCLVKGAAAGWISALVFKALNKVHFAFAIVLAAAVAPIVNTGLFLVAMLLFFRTTLTAWAGGTALLSYIFIDLVGLNFLVEFAVNLIFSPAVVTVVRAVGKKTAH